MAFGVELFLELELVVKLAVVGDPDGAVFVGHGLSAAGQVDDRQPAMPERRWALTVKSLAVWSAAAMVAVMRRRIARSAG